MPILYILFADQVPLPPLKQVAGNVTNCPDMEFPPVATVPVRVIVMSMLMMPPPHTYGPYDPVIVACNVVPVSVPVIPGWLIPGTGP